MLALLAHTHTNLTARILSREEEASEPPTFEAVQPLLSHFTKLTTLHLDGLAFDSFSPKIECPKFALTELYVFANPDDEPGGIDDDLEPLMWLLASSQNTLASVSMRCCFKPSLQLLLGYPFPLTRIVLDMWAEDDTWSFDWVLKVARRPGLRQLLVQADCASTKQRIEFSQAITMAGSKGELGAELVVTLIWDEQDEEELLKLVLWPMSA